MYRRKRSWNWNLLGNILCNFSAYYNIFFFVNKQIKFVHGLRTLKVRCGDTDMYFDFMLKEIIVLCS